MITSKPLSSNDVSKNLDKSIITYYEFGKYMSIAKI